MNFKLTLRSLGVFLATLLFSWYYYQSFPHVPSNLDELSIFFQVETFLTGRLAVPPPAPFHLFETHFILGDPFWVSKMWPLLSAPLALAKFIFNEPLFAHMILISLYSVILLLIFRKRLNNPLTLISILLFSSFNVFYQAASINFFRSGIVASVASALSLLAWSLPSRGGVLLYYLGIAILSQTRGGEGFIFFLSTLPFQIHWQLKFLSKAQVLKYFSIFVVVCGSVHIYYNYQTVRTIFTHPNFVYEQRYQQNRRFLFGQNTPEATHRREEVNQFFEEYESKYQSYITSGFKEYIKYSWQKLKKYSLFHYGDYWFVFFLLGLLLVTKMPWLTPVSFFSLLSINMSFVFFITYDLRDYTAVVMPLLHMAMINGITGSFQILERKSLKALCLLIFSAVLILGSLRNMIAGLNFSASRTTRSNFHKPDFTQHLPNGKNLIFVDQSLNDDSDNIWTYNSPNLEQAQNIFIWTPRESDSDLEKDQITAATGRRMWCIYIDRSYPIMLHEVTELPTSCRLSWKQHRQSKTKLEDSNAPNSADK